jgi:hypothetical protein
MKIDFNQELKTIEGETLQRARRKGNQVVEEPATLRWAAVEALLTVPPKDTLPGEEKARRYDLALKIQESNGSIDLSVDDISFIKTLCDGHFAPLVMGQTRLMLEGKTTQE